MMSFEQAVEYLGRLGVEFNRDYDYGKQGTDERHHFDVNVFTGFHLPLTADEWCDLCMREGDHYIGGCCGTTSAAQDIVNGAFRDGGWIDVPDLERLVSLLANHDEMPGAACPFTPPTEPVGGIVQRVWDKWSEVDPWSKIALIWHIAKDYARAKVPRATGKHLSELEAAMYTLENGLRFLSYERVFKWGQDESGNLDSQARAQRSLTLARTLPALNVVYEQIHKLDLGPFEGFALIDKEKGPESIAENGMGLCLYATQGEVDATLKLWREQEMQYEERRERVKPIDERIGVRRVRVTKEKGLEFLDENPTT